MFVVFEGIDGSGKTTVSNLVAKRLRKRGMEITHVRESGTFASPLVNRMREFAKDPRNLTMAPLTELLLYVGRDAQLAGEHIRPALAQGGLVFADRYLYSYEVLSHFGRGLPRDTVRSIIQTVAGGLWPDMVILMDVDPFIARARRRVSKIAKRGGEEEESDPGGGSRKGLYGVGLSHWLRLGYLQLAQEDPKRWIIVDNNSDSEAPTERQDGSLEAIVGRLTELIAQRAEVIRQEERRVSPHELEPAAITLPRAPANAPRPAAPANTPALDMKSAAERFYCMVEHRARREVAVATYLLAGIAESRAYDLLDAWAEEAPHVVAYSLRGMGDTRAWQLRERLATRAPYHVARSLDGLEVEGERAMDMRAAMLAEQPTAVLATLDGNDSDAAWRLRERVMESHLGQVVSSLKRLDSDRAWALRDRYYRAIGGELATDPRAIVLLVSSLRGLHSDRAAALRERYLELLPVPVLETLPDVSDERAWQLRLAYAEHAPKIVMRTFDGSTDERAWQLRARYAPRVKEALASLIDVADERAWELRIACRDIWPSTAVKTLGLLSLSERGHAFITETLAAHPDNISLLKHITRLMTMPVTASGKEAKQRVV